MDPASAIARAWGGALNDFFILLIGRPGSGKTHFISECRNSSVKSLRALKCDGTRLEMNSFQVSRNRTIHLVDTPSCSYSSDVQALCDLAEWLATLYALDIGLSGVIFFHPVDKGCMSANDIREVNFLKALVGKGSLHRVTLATTKWSIITQGTGIEREAELLSFLALYERTTSNGTQTLRYSDSPDSAMKIIQAALSQDKHLTLAIQDEMVNHCKHLKETAIGTQILEHLEKEARRLEEELMTTQKAIKATSKHFNFNFNDNKRLIRLQSENQQQYARMKAQRSVLESHSALSFTTVKREGVSFMELMGLLVAAQVFTPITVGGSLASGFMAGFKGFSLNELIKSTRSSEFKGSTYELSPARTDSTSERKPTIPNPDEKWKPSSPNIGADDMKISEKKTPMKRSTENKDALGSERSSEVSKPLTQSKPDVKPKSLGSLVRIFQIDATKDAALISVWKDSLLPNIGSLVPNNGDTSVSVSLLRRGNSLDDSEPVLRVQTSKPRTKEQQREIVQSIQKLLASFAPVPVIFVKGSIKRTATRSDLDARPCPPHNTGFSPRPPMGVSIGVGGSTRDTATLGGYIYIDDVPHILTVHHLFVDDDTEEVFAPGTAVSQPSLQEVKEFADLWERIRAKGEPFHAACVREVFENMKSSLPAFSFATLAHSSGFRNRKSRDGESNVEMDWAICKVERNRTGYNITPCNTHKVRKIANIVPGAKVFAVGRTSGKQIGAVNGCTTYLSFMDEEGNMRESQEWIILRPDTMAEQTWISSGIGVSGDSGAWVLESVTANVIGLLWGRNYEAGQDESDGEVFTYFTPILDIFDDIKDHIHPRSIITISTNQRYDLLNDTRSQHIAHGSIANLNSPEPSSANVCRICNQRVSNREAQESTALLGNEIAGLNMARQQNQMLLKLRGLSIPRPS